MLPSLEPRRSMKSWRDGRGPGSLTGGGHKPLALGMSASDRNARHDARLRKGWTALHRRLVEGDAAAQTALLNPAAAETAENHASCDALVLSPSIRYQACASFA